MLKAVAAVMQRHAARRCYAPAARTAAAAATPSSVLPAAAPWRAASSSSAAPASAGGTVDKAEVAKFSAQAGRWWQEERGPFAGLHKLNQVRVPFIREALVDDAADAAAVAEGQMGSDGLLRSMLPQNDSSAPGMARAGATGRALPLEGLRILDIGCGGGILAEGLARLGAQVTGLDASAENVAAASYHATLDPVVQQRTTYVASTAEALAEEVAAGTRQQFDAVIASEVLEHVADAGTFLGAAAALTKPGGKLVVTTINRTSRSFALAILAAEYVLRIVPAGTHEWAKFVTPQELGQMLGQHGMTLTRTCGLRYNPLTAAWSLALADTEVNYAAVAVKRLT